MKRWATWIADREPALVLVAGPFLVGREWAALPDWTEGVALAWLALLWVARRIARGRWTTPTAIDLPVLALLLTLPGAVWAAWDGHRPAAFSRAESLIFAIALAYAVANGVSTPRRTWRIATGILLLGLGLGAAGVLTVDWIAKYPLLEPVLERLPRATQTVPHATLRAPAHPNQLAGVLAMVVPLALSILLWRRASSRKRSRRAPRPASPVPAFARQAALLAMVLLLPPLVLAQSRGAWGALALTVLGMGGLAWLKRRAHRRSAAARWQPVVVPVLLLLGLLLAVAPGMVQALRTDQLPAPPEISTEQDRQALRFTATSRLYLWRDSLRMLEREPLTGIGLHNFVWRQANREENEGLLIYPGFSHSHNLVLQAALDYGLPGAVAVVGLAGALAWAGFGAFSRLSGSALQGLVIGASGGLMVWGLHGLVDAVAVGSKVGFMPWSLAGLLVGLRAHGRRLANAEAVGIDMARERRESIRPGVEDIGP